MAFLRKRIERLVPGERFSKKEASTVFSGGYMFAGKIIKVVTTKNYLPSTTENYPYVLDVVRETTSGVQKHSANSPIAVASKTIDYTLLDTLNTDTALERANKVERIARRIKAGIGITAMLLTGGLIVNALADDAAEKAADGTVPCEQVVSGDEILVPATSISEDIRSALGSICTIADNKFVVVEQS